ncbi:MAG: rhodanese-like domain-containing protein [Acidaminococcaceae bacterium]|nr:rhodanese-like domain-containing protein [Acidaminococcaceae bacterium]
MKAKVKTYSIISLLFVLLFCVSACTPNDKNATASGTNKAYTQIGQDAAKDMILKDSSLIIVDVRTKGEYEGGHIPGAVLIPNESIKDRKPELLPDVNQVILVYCRSGNRSKQAAQKLANMGYKKVYEFGGINTWNGKIVK